MSHLRNIEKWLGEQLSAQPTTKEEANGAYNTMAVEGAPFPYVVFVAASREQVNRTLCGAVESIQVNYEVVALSNTGYDSLNNLEDAIHALLDAASVPAETGRAAFDVRLSAEIRRLYYSNSSNSMLYEVGGEFSFFVTP